MVGNAHIDPVWQWRWTEGCAEAIGTCWAAIDRLEEDTDFIFTRGEAIVYRWIEELEPRLFSRIQHFVHEGRWVVVNGWWLQPDCNLPTGEAFVRQGLYGKTYFREKFGIDVKVGYNVDSFGHAGTLPMLLQHMGFEHYVFMRPSSSEKTLPTALFDWIAPNGSRVNTFRLTDEYQTVVDPLAEKIKRAEAYIQQCGQPIMCFYGVGNHGGGPTRENIALINRLRAEGRPLLFSDPVRYFAAVKSIPRPEVRDELQQHAIGCYSALSAIKALNRRCEARLAQAEAASALALHNASASYPHAQLRQLWEKLLFNQFHDIVGGACIASAVRDTLETLGGIVQEAEERVNTALRQLAAMVTPGPGNKAAAFLVFNLTGAEQHVPIEYEPWLNREALPHRLFDHDGNEVLYQELASEGFVQTLYIRRLLFTARITPFSYQLYTVEVGEPRISSTTGLHISSTSLENAAWRLEIDAKTGGIAHLVEKSTGRDIFEGIAHQPLLIEDLSDTWSHGLDRYGIEGPSAVCERIEVVEQGPLRASIRVHARLGSSLIVNTYALYNDPALLLEIHVRIDWHEKNKLLRLRYPANFSQPTFRYEVPAGSLERPADGRECPGQRWVLLTDSTGYGLALANDAKYSYAALDNALYITALRSPVYAHHDPYILQEENDYLYTDQGEQEFTLRLRAGQDIHTLAAQHMADELLRPPVVIPHVSRNGSGPYSASLLPITTNSSLVTTLKGAENGQGLVMRLLEVEGKVDTALLGPDKQEQTLQPYDIVTLRNDGTERWRASNGLEEI
jgi:alpha-mannosidase